MGVVTVELDDEALFAPEEVGFDEAVAEWDVGVDLGAGKAVGIEEGEKAVFELASGEDRLDPRRTTSRSDLVPLRRG